MKKTIGATIGVLVVVAFALAIVPTMRDEIYWRWASYKDETPSYELYLKTFPEGRHVAEAHARYEENGWRDAQTANTVEGFERFIQLHGEGKHLTEAKENIESLHWQETVTANTVEGFERFIQLHGEDKHLAEAKDNIDLLHWQEAINANTIKSYRAYISLLPKGKFAQKAETKAFALRTNIAPFDTALRVGTEVSLNKFIEDFPGHDKESDAQKAIKEISEGRDLEDLLKENKIEIMTQGSGIQSVTFHLRKLVPYTMKVRVPIGTYFVSSKHAVQNMVVTEESIHRLISDHWVCVSAPAACANFARDIPGGDDSFSVRRLPHQADLSRLMLTIDKAEISYPAMQAAVWIVTDDVSYNEMGRLVEKHTGRRIIDETIAYRAIEIIVNAGINIREKRIWNDFKRIRGVALSKRLWTPTVKGDIDKVRELILGGADLNYRAREGAPFTIMAAVQGGKEMLDIYLKNGASLKGKRGTWALYQAVTRTDPSERSLVITTLLAHGAELNSWNWDGDTPLCGAISNGDIETVKVLVKCGADVNLPSGNITTLVGNGSPVTKFELVEDNTPLKMAINEGKREIVNILIRAGARQEKKN